MMTELEVRRKIAENPIGLDLEGVQEIRSGQIEEYIDRYLETYVNPDLATYRSVIRKMITRFLQVERGFDGTTEMISSEDVVFRLPKEANRVPDWLGDVRIS